mgnify:CR=1 FL=1
MALGDLISRDFPIFALFDAIKCHNETKIPVMKGIKSSLREISSENLAFLTLINSLCK